MLASLTYAPWLALLWVLSACSTATQPESLGVSREFEPPRGWESAIFFSIADSTRFPELPYGARAEFSARGEAPVVTTGRDLFQAPNGELRTPWYALPLNGQRQRLITIRVVVGDRDGRESVAHYDLAVEKDVFYELHLGVASRTPPRQHAPALLDGIRAYPVHAAVQRAQGDSLFIGYKTRTRNCFDCSF